jgi:signal transduction histidine kinase
VRINDILTVICIGAGASIMLLAVLKTAKLRKLLVAGVNNQRWTWLARFMVVFFIGYLVAILLIVFGYHEPLLLITGLVFLLGSFFVYLVVYSAKSDIQKIHDSNELLAEKNDELRKINLELDQFAYRTSHDLKAPITSMKGLIHVASLSNSSEEILQCHNMMKDRLTNLENLIRDILDLSKNSRTDIKSTPTHVHSVIEEICSNHTYGNDAIELIIDGDTDLNVTIDTTRFKIVLTNLIANARQYADRAKPQPFVRIDYWSESSSLFVSVKDNGTGISKEYLQKIFDMFFRVEETSQGSGLGLYIVKETTEKMGGTIDVISEKGVGSEFIVSLPTN